ncbi:unnamed protein product [Prorocentrum cordatum]|uniref:Ribosome assembly protein 3 n=1 Tax=Prorocentrum cordatum TaxID=2364126 RepID=A0ABN9SBD3_9DINO|nr:unnamed protein product [Polarella glacialis]
MAPKRAVKAVKQEKQVCVDAAAQDKKRQNDFAYKLMKAPHRTKEFYDKGLKHLKASKSAEKEEFIRQTLATVDSRWSDLDHDDPTTKELPEEEQLQYKVVEIKSVTEVGTVNEARRSTKGSGGEGPPPPEEEEQPTEDKAKISKIKKQHNAYSPVTVDFKMKLAKFSDNRHVEQFYAEANASFKAAKKNDSKIIKFLEKVSHGDAIPTEEVENAAALADELKDDVATVRDYLSMMATIATRLTKKRERSAAADTDGEA